MTQTLTPAVQAQLNNLPGFPAQQQFKLGDYLAQPANLPQIVLADSTLLDLAVTVPSAGYYDVRLYGYPTWIGVVANTCSPLVPSGFLTSASRASALGYNAGVVRLLSDEAEVSSFTITTLAYTYLEIKGVLQVTTSCPIGWRMSPGGWLRGSSLVVTRIG